MPKPQPIVTARSPANKALEDAWAAIRHHHPEVPEVFIVVGAESGTKQHRRQWHPATGWQGDDQRLSVDREGLNRGAVVVLGTLLHEAAHALARVRNTNGTSRRGRCHNRRFAKLAEELGLRHDRRLGWSWSTPTTGTIARYRTALDNLDRALRTYRHYQSTDGSNTTPSTDPVACACDGGRRIRVSRTGIGAGPIICQVCGSRFDPH